MHGSHEDSFHGVMAEDFAIEFPPVCIKREVDSDEEFWLIVSGIQSF